MDCAILSCSEVMHSLFILWEVNTKTTSVNEGHAAFLIALYTSKDIFAAWVSFSFELHELSELKTFLHRPFDYSTIT